MSKYRKKPVIVEAFRWTGDVKTTKCSYEAIQAREKGIIKIDGENLIIRTLEGDMIASKGDYIIKGINGEFYPCKPGVFQKTYELVE